MQDLFASDNRSTRLDSLLQHLPQAQNADAPLSERMALLAAVTSTLGIPIRELAGHLIKAATWQEVRFAIVGLHTSGECC